MARKDYIQKSFTYNGKRYYVYGKTDEEANQNRAVKKAMLEAGHKEYDGSTTVREWADSWLEDYIPDTVSPKWKKQIEAAIRLHIVPQIGSMKLRNVKPADITRLFNAYADASQTKAATIVQTTRRIFSAAEENDLIGKNPARNVKPPKYKAKKRHRVITARERELTILVANKYMEDGLFFLIMLYCGLRPQEVAALKMKDYDRKKKVLHVERARKAGRNEIGTTKTEAGKRDVPVPDALAVILDQRDRTPNELMVTAPRGGMYTETAQRRLWDRFKKAMEIENGAKVGKRGVLLEKTLADDFQPYCYRHTYCTSLKDAGVGLVEAKYLMGHTSIRMTADVYSHHSQESLDDARDKINSHFEEIK